MGSGERGVDGFGGVVLDDGAEAEEELENLRRGLEEKGVDPVSVPAGPGFFISGSSEDEMEKDGLKVAFSGYLLEKGGASAEQRVAEEYRRRGDSFPVGLDGSYRAALFDTEKSAFYLATDKMGTQTLYHAEVDGGLLFSSHLTPLLATSRVHPEIDRKGMVDFLSSHTSPPYSGGRTLLKGVKRMKPGEIIVRSGDASGSRLYWDVPDRTRERPVTEIVERTREMLEEAAELHLGEHRGRPRVMFSGGLDSSFLAVLLDRVGDSPVETFTFGVTDGMLAAGRGAAEEIGLPHTEVRFPSTLPGEEEVWTMEEPRWSMVHRRHALLPSHGITECVSGYAGEAVFPHGFGRFMGNSRGARYLARALRRTGLDSAILKIPRVPREFGTRIDVLASPHLSSTVTLAEASPREKKLESLLPGDGSHGTGGLPGHIDRRWNLSEKSFDGIHDARPYLLLREHLSPANAASMFRHMRHHPVFLYPPLVSYQFGLPMGQREDRRILKGVAKEFLPESLVERRPEDVPAIRREFQHYLHSDREGYRDAVKSFLSRGLMDRSSAEPYLLPDPPYRVPRGRMIMMGRVYLLEKWIQAVIEREKGWKRP